MLRRDLRTQCACELQYNGILAAALIPSFGQIDAGAVFFGLLVELADTMADPCNRAGLRIPIYSGRVFRSEAGHRSDLKPATIPK
jgi:hypothetical protein